VTDSLPDVPMPSQVVRRLGGWAVGRSRGEDFAVSRRCRHQLGDLSSGRVDADGCLVCPWHGARYDVRDGRMVDGPRGLLFYHGPTSSSRPSWPPSQQRAMRYRAGSCVRPGM
jgi:nitrite reductase/ring-hydroxylating ferredoxin subunit